MFKDQVVRNMEVYIDDMLLKVKARHDYRSNLREAFKVLKKYGMKLNPLKCAFRVASGQVLGLHCE